MWIRETDPRERRTLIAAFAGWGVDAFDTMIYTLLISTLLAAWGMTKTQAGLIFSAFAYPYLLFQIGGGWVADKFGPRIALTICGIAMIAIAATTEVR